MDSRRRAILAAGLCIYASSVLPQPTEKLPKSGLGTWQTFDAGNDSAARAPLREVLKLLDGNVVDSSPMYGSSESVAGDLIAELKMRERLFIATKVWTSGRDVGIAHYTASAYAEVERLLKTGAYDFVQINYSLAERDAEKRLLPLAAERKISAIINRPFAEGALFRRTKGKPLPPWAGELGIESWAQYFLKWLVSHPAVTCAIPGT